MSLRGEDPPVVYSLSSFNAIVVLTTNLVHKYLCRGSSSFKQSIFCFSACSDTSRVTESDQKIFGPLPLRIDAQDKKFILGVLILKYDISL